MHILSKMFPCFCCCINKNAQINCGGVNEVGAEVKSKRTSLRKKSKVDEINTIDISSRSQVSPERQTPGINLKKKLSCVQNEEIQKETNEHFDVPII